ncbi:MAG TPA: site-specific integrase [Bacteroidota bacterium]|nr:site-specific integrase [Bacteroidota bacterium]
MQFLEYAQTNFAGSTVLLYEQAIRKFISLIGDYPVKSYSVQDVELFKKKRLEQVSAVKTNIDFRTMKACFQTAVRWKLIQENAFRSARQIRVPQERPCYLSKEAFSVLIDAIDIDWFKNLVIFAIFTMMRAGEIASLSWNSIDLNRRIIIVENSGEFRLKTGKPRIVPMNDWVFKFLATRLRKEGRVFSFPDGKSLSVGYISRRFKKFVRKAAIPEDIHFHSLRHTGASWLVQDGVSIYAIQRLLGHSSISVTQVYSHLETDGLFSSVERLQLPKGKMLDEGQEGRGSGEEAGDERGDARESVGGVDNEGKETENG